MKKYTQKLYKNKSINKILNFSFHRIKSFMQILFMHIIKNLNLQIFFIILLRVKQKKRQDRAILLMRSY